MIIIGSPNSTGWPSSTRICVTMPPRGAGIWFIVFIASMISSGVAGLHALADLDEWLGAGRRREIGGADHRRGQHARMFGEIGAGRGSRRKAGRCDQRRGADADRTRGPSDPDALAVAFDLDLGQPGLVEQLGEPADGVLVIRRRILSRSGPVSCLFQTPRVSPSMM